MAVKQKIVGNSLLESIALVELGLENIEAATANYIAQSTEHNRGLLDSSITNYRTAKQRLGQLGETPGYGEAVRGALAVCADYEGRVAQQLNAAKRAVYQKTVPGRSTEPFMWGFL